MSSLIIDIASAAVAMGNSIDSPLKIGAHCWNTNGVADAEFLSLAVELSTKAKKLRGVDGIFTTDKTIMKTFFTRHGQNPALVTASDPYFGMAGNVKVAGDYFADQAKYYRDELNQLDSVLIGSHHQTFQTDRGPVFVVDTVPQDGTMAKLVVMNLQPDELPFSLLSVSAWLASAVANGSLQAAPIQDVSIPMLEFDASPDLSFLQDAWTKDSIGVHCVINEAYAHYHFRHDQFGFEGEAFTYIGGTRGGLSFKPTSIHLIRPPFLAFMLQEVDGEIIDIPIISFIAENDICRRPKPKNQK